MLNAGSENLLFQEEILDGERYEISPEIFNPEKPQLFYQHKNGEFWAGNSIEWLKTLPENSVDLVFADPPYNIKKANWDDF